VSVPRHVVTAPTDLDVLAKLEGPLVYLSGPIQGTADWHADAIAFLGDIAPELHVASPRARNFTGGPEVHMAWEQAFIECAALDGVILFWLARETSHRCNRTYAAQIRFELGEWAVKSSIGLARLVVGIERGFTGGPYLQRRLTTSYPQVPVCRTLRQACAAAAELAQRETPLVVYPRALSELFAPQPFGGKNNG
jgi:hypothetical protein